MRTICQVRADIDHSFAQSIEISAQQTRMLQQSVLFAPTKSARPHDTRQSLFVSINGLFRSFSVVITRRHDAVKSAADFLYRHAQIETLISAYRCNNFLRVVMLRRSVFGVLYARH